MRVSDARWTVEVRRARPNRPGPVAAAPRPRRGDPRRNRFFMTLRDSVIVSAVRLPTGKFLGALKDFTAPQLGALVVARRWPAPGSIPTASTSASWATSSRPGNGQNPARQAALNGGLADHVAALTINKVCGSGLKAVMLAAQGIATGDIDDRGRRRHGVDEQRALPAAARARRAAHGQRRAGRLDGARRPVVRVRAVPHGHVGRGRRRDVLGRRAASRTSTPPASHRKAAARHPARLVHATRSCRSRFRRRRVSRSSSIATSRSAKTRPPRRSAR